MQRKVIGTGLHCKEVCFIADFLACIDKDINVPNSLPVTALSYANKIINVETFTDFNLICLCMIDTRCMTVDLA